MAQPPSDEVHKPSHYQLPGHPDLECIDVVEALQLDLCLGSAFQYIWRAGRKGDTVAKAIVDLKKAQWYIARRIAQLESAQTTRCPTRGCFRCNGHEGPCVKEASPTRAPA